MVSFLDGVIVWNAVAGEQSRWQPLTTGAAGELLAVLLAGLLVWLAFLLGLFPADGRAGVPQIDLVGHSIGLVLGSGVALNWALFFEVPFVRGVDWV